MPSEMSQLAVLQYLPEGVLRYLSWYVAGTIIVFGLLIYGFRDLLKFSFTRAWAISGVVFTDAVRRKVLWVTPLAMLGIVVVAQLQRPFDGQDAIRQTIQACLFVTALVVTILALILAVTNLPREIENKVVFTVTTKPVTRLEIALGKVMGFGRVTALILLIMGVFVWGYCHVRAWSYEREYTDEQRVNPASQLLATRTLGATQRLSVLAAPEMVEASKGAPDFGWMLPQTQEAMLPFEMPREVAQAFEGQPYELYLEVRVATAPILERQADRPAMALPPLGAVQVQFLTLDSTALAPQEAVNGGAPVTLTDDTGQQWTRVPLDSRLLNLLAQVPAFFVSLTGVEPSQMYGIPDTDAMRLVVALGEQAYIAEPLPRIGEIVFQRPSLRGKSGQHGTQLRGPEEGLEMIAVYEFRNIPRAVETGGRVPMQFRVGIERSGADSDREDVTNVRVEIINHTLNEVFQAGVIQPESNRTLYFGVDPRAVEGGNFDVRLRNLTFGHVIGLRYASLALVLDQRGFAWNLFKSLGMLWMFTLLVGSIALCTSTFLSWPIAFVLTLVILLGRWVVELLGDSLGPGAGSAFAQSLFGAGGDFAQARVVSQTVDALSKALVTLANLLPDISAFGTNELMERGIAIPLAQILAAGQVLLLFAVPLTVLAYVFLRNKEVAP